MNHLYIVKSHYFDTCCSCCWLSGVDNCLSHHELKPSVSPVLNP